MEKPANPEKNESAPSSSARPAPPDSIVVMLAAHPELKARLMTALKCRQHLITISYIHGDCANDPRPDKHWWVFAPNLPGQAQDCPVDKWLKHICDQWMGRHKPDAMLSSEAARDICRDLVLEIQQKQTDRIIANTQDLKPEEITVANMREIFFQIHDDEIDELADVLCQWKYGKTSWT